MALSFEMDSRDFFISTYGRDTFEGAAELNVATREALDLEALASGIFTRWRMANRSDFHPTTEEESAWFLKAFKLLEAAAEMENLAKAPMMRASEMDVKEVAGSSRSYRSA